MNRLDKAFLEERPYLNFLSRPKEHEQRWQVNQYQNIIRRLRDDLALDRLASS